MTDRLVIETSEIMSNLEQAKVDTTNHLRQQAVKIAGLRAELQSALRGFVELRKYCRDGLPLSAETIIDFCDEQDKSIRAVLGEK